MSTAPAVAVQPKTLDCCHAPFYPIAPRSTVRIARHTHNCPTRKVLPC